jgi:hypothetical protein
MVLLGAGLALGVFLSAAPRSGPAVPAAGLAPKPSEDAQAAVAPVAAPENPPAALETETPARTVASVVPPAEQPPETTSSVKASRPGLPVKPLSRTRRRVQKAPVVRVRPPAPATLHHKSANPNFEPDSV